MQTIVNGAPIYFEQFGQGTPVLCIHGFPEDHRAMAGCMEPVFSGLDGYRRLYIDLPGMGRSPANPIIKSADDMMNTVQLFIEQVIGGEDFLLAAQSYGGYLSLGLALKFPKRIKGIFFLCPCVVADRLKRTLPSKPLLQGDAIRLRPCENQTDLDDFLSMAAVVTEETWNRYKKEILPGIKCADATFTEYYQREGYAFSFESDFGKLKFDGPVTFLLGRLDNCVGYEDACKLSAGFPNGSFEVLDGAGHNLQIERPDCFEKSFINWLSREKTIS